MIDLMGQDFVFLSDGTRVAFVVGKDTVYFCEVAFPMCMSLNTSCNRIDVTCMDGSGRRFLPGRIEHEIDIKMKIIGPVTMGGEELLKKFVPVDSLSIEGLFKVIQERIRERS